MSEFAALKFLTGAVALPAMFPELARVKSVGQSLEITDDRPHWCVTRTVDLADVIAVFIPCQTNPDVVRSEWRSAGRWFTGNSITDGRLAGDGQLAIVYVREHAVVLMKAEFGMNAAESAEYCPTHSLRACNPCCEGRAMH